MLEDKIDGSSISKSGEIVSVTKADCAGTRYGVRTYVASNSNKFLPSAKQKNTVEDRRFSETSLSILLKHYSSRIKP